MPALQNISSRILDFAWIPASKLTPHELNPRRHPNAQRRALEETLKRHGWNDALKAFVTGAAQARTAKSKWANARKGDEFPPLTLFDGHLRQDLIEKDELVPVLVTDLTTREAREAMLAHDPISGMADYDVGNLDKLMASVRWRNPPLNHRLSEILKSVTPATDEPDAGPPQRRDPKPEVFEVIVHAETAEQQDAIFERLKADGLDVVKVNK